MLCVSLDSSDKVQITAATCFKLIVSLWPESVIKKHHNQLINLINIGIKAPRSEVRSLMRDSQEILTQKLGAEWSFIQLIT